MQTRAIPARLVEPPLSVGILCLKFLEGLPVHLTLRYGSGFFFAERFSIRLEVVYDGCEVVDLIVTRGTCETRLVWPCVLMIVRRRPLR